MDESDWLSVLPPLVDLEVNSDEELTLLFLLPTLLPRSSKEALLLAAFEQYGAKKVCMECYSSAALYGCGATSGISVDIGYTGVRIDSVVRGLPLVHLSTSHDDVGGFYVETELLPSFPCSSDDDIQAWRGYMYHILPQLETEEREAGGAVLLPDGASISVNIPQNTIQSAVQRLISSTNTNISDAVWFTRLHTTEPPELLLCSGGMSDWRCASGTFKDLLGGGGALLPPIPTVTATNGTSSAVMGGSILSQLTGFKNMCVTVDDYKDEGPQGCVRQYCTDPR